MLLKAYEKTFEVDFRFPMAAMLVQGNRIVGFGTNNKNCSHPLQKQRVNSKGELYGRKRPHAELSCLIATPYPLIEGATMYVVRRKKSGGVGLAKPCNNCMVHIENHKIKKIVYSLNSENFENWYTSMRVKCGASKKIQ